MFFINFKWYLINFKNKTFKKILKIIIKILFFKNKLKNINKIIIINEDLLEINKKKYKKKYFYKHTGYLGNIKKWSYLKLYIIKKRELIKNMIIKNFKNNKIRKVLKKNIKFLKNKENIKNTKSKILNF